MIATGNPVTPTPAAPAGPPVQRQRVLPLSKALEIAYKNIRMRLGRSLVVTSGIVLALAFLMSILANEAMTGGMRRWLQAAKAETAASGSTHFADLRRERDRLARQATPLERKLREDLSSAAARPAAQGAAAFDPEDEPAIGKSWEDLQAELGALPAPPAELTKALTNAPDLAGALREWVDLTRRQRAVKDQLTAPQQLETLMQSNGVAVAETDVAANRVQTRWLVGLALLVAFVGILNAMLMSVTERFREIGTMKCLGALDSFIIKLFLLESLFQGVVGTVIGVALGLALSMIGLSVTYGGFAWKNVPVGEILTGVALCLAVGVGLTVAAAVYPAWQAARMQPIEAMRAET